MEDPSREVIIEDPVQNEQVFYYKNDLIVKGRKSLQKNKHLTKRKIF